MSRQHQDAGSVRRWAARRTRGPLLTAIVMGAGAINAEVSIMLDRSDEGTSAVALPAFIVGLILATTLIHRRTRA